MGDAAAMAAAAAGGDAAANGCRAVHGAVAPVVVDMSADDAAAIKAKVLSALGPGSRSTCPMFAVANYGFEKLFAEVVVAPDETVILLHPPLPFVGVSIVMKRGCQQNDSLVNG